MYKNLYNPINYLLYEKETLLVLNNELVTLPCKAFPVMQQLLSVV